MERPKPSLLLKLTAIPTIGLALIGCKDSSTVRGIDDPTLSEQIPGKVCIGRQETVVLKADFEEDLRAVIKNEGTSNPNPGRRISTVKNSVSAKYEGTSPTPIPSRVSFGGMKIHNMPDGTVCVLYPSMEKSPENLRTWSVMKVIRRT